MSPTPGSMSQMGTTLSTAECDSPKYYREMERQIDREGRLNTVRKIDRKGDR